MREKDSKSIVELVNELSRKGSMYGRYDNLEEALEDFVSKNSYLRTSDIAKISGLNNVTTQTYLEKLEKKGIIKKVVTGSLRLWIYVGDE